MANEHLELIRRLYQASAATFETGDLERLDSSLYDPDVEWHDATEQPDAQSYVGFEGVKRAMGRFLDAWAEYECDIEQILPGGAGRLVVFTHERGTGSTSGLEIDQRGAHVWKFRDARVVEFRAYWDRQRALRVAGVRDRAG